MGSLRKCCFLLTFMGFGLLFSQHLSAAISGKTRISKQAQQSWSACANALKALHRSTVHAARQDFSEAFAGYYSKLEDDLGRSLGPRELQMALTKNVKYGGGRFHKLVYKHNQHKFMESHFKWLGPGRKKLRFDIEVDSSMRQMGVYDLALRHVLSLNPGIDSFPAMLAGLNKKVFFEGLGGKLTNKAQLSRDSVLQALQRTPVFKMRQKHGFSQVNYVRVDLFRAEVFVSFSRGAALRPADVVIVSKKGTELFAERLNSDATVEFVDLALFVDRPYEASLQLYERFP